MNKFLIGTIGGAFGALLLSGCDVDKTQEAALPDVEVEGGQMPEYDVQGPDVDVGTEERTITTPDVDIETEKRDVTVPDVDVDMPKD